MWNLVNLLNTFLRHSLRIFSFSRFSSSTFFVVFWRFVQSIQTNCASPACYIAKHSAKLGQKIEECLIHSSQPGLYTFILLPCNVPAARQIGSGVALRLGQGELRQQGLQLRLGGAAHRGALLQHAARKSDTRRLQPQLFGYRAHLQGQLAACLSTICRAAASPCSAAAPTSGASAATLPLAETRCVDLADQLPGRRQPAAPRTLHRAARWAMRPSSARTTAARASRPRAKPPPSSSIRLPQPPLRASRPSVLWP